VDAHALIWYLENNPRLGPDARRALDDSESKLYVPAIALAEACWIAEHGRSRIPSVQALLADMDADARVIVVPLDRRVLDVAATLTAIGEMHDRQIVATVLQLADTRLSVAVLTRDENITASGLVEVVW